MPGFDWWSVEHKEIIENAQNNIGVKIAIGSGYDGLITCDVDKLLTADYDLVISFRHTLSCFVIWSTGLNRSLSRKRFDVGKSTALSNLLRAGIQEDQIIPFYKQIRDQYQNPLGYQKILFVGINRLQEVVEHYEEFIFPNPDDEGYMEPICVPNENGDPVFVSTSDNVPQVLVNANISRCRDRIDRARRNYSFRKAVLERWNNRCAVCGETEMIVLQAAHIVAVKDGGNDSPNNGICLCANHHLMFDGENGKQLIAISEDQRTFSCSSASEKKKEWYVQARNRGLTLFPSRY